MKKLGLVVVMSLLTMSESVIAKTGHLLVSSTSFSNIVSFDVVDYKIVNTLNLPPAKSMVTTSDKLYFSSSNSSFIQVYDFESHLTKDTNIGNGNSILNINNGYLYASHDSVVSIHDLENLNQVAEINIGSVQAITSDERRIFISSGGSSEIMVYDAKSLGLIKTFGMNGIRAMAVNDNKLYAYSTGGTGIWVYDLNNYQLVSNIIAGNSRALAFSSEGTLYSASDLLEVIDVSSRRVTGTFNFSGNVNALAFEVSSVDEQPILASLFVGMTLIGIFAKRRRKADSTSLQSSIY